MTIIFLFLSDKKIILLFLRSVTDSIVHFQSSHIVLYAKITPKNGRPSFGTVYSFERYSGEWEIGIIASRKASEIIVSEIETLSPGYPCERIVSEGFYASLRWEKESVHRSGMFQICGLSGIAGDKRQDSEKYAWEYDGSDEHFNQSETGFFERFHTDDICNRVIIFQYIRKIKNPHFFLKILFHKKPVFIFAIRKIKFTIGRFLIFYNSHLYESISFSSKDSCRKSFVFSTQFQFLLSRSESRSSRGYDLCDICGIWPESGILIGRYI